MNEGQTLEDFLRGLPEGIPYNEMRWMEGYDDDDRISFGFSYRVRERNPDYEEQLKRWEGKKKEYEEKVVKYREDKKVYDAWHQMSDEEKQVVEDKRKAALKFEKIKKLEEQLQKLKGGE